MLQPDPSNKLLHEYDPVAAREYYLRTRELKGRKKGLAKQVSDRTPSSKPAGQTATLGIKPAGPTATSKAVAKSAQVRKVRAEKVRVLHAKFERLKKIMENLRKELRDAESKSPEKSSLAKSGDSKKAAPDKPQTAEQKRKAKVAYEKLKKKEAVPANDVQVLREKIAKIEKTIQEIRADLEAAKQKQTKKAAPSR